MILLLITGFSGPCQAVVLLLITVFTGPCLAVILLLISVFSGPCHAVFTGVLQGLHHGHENAQQDSEEGMRCHPGNDEGPSLSPLHVCLSVSLSVLCCRVGAWKQ